MAFKYWGSVGDLAAWEVWLCLLADLVSHGPRGCLLWRRKWKWSRSVALCNPMDCSLQVSSIHGIFQARVLEWVAISFSRGSSRPRDWTQISSFASRHFYSLSHRNTRQGQVLGIQNFLLPWFSLFQVSCLKKKKRIIISCFTTLY